MPKLIGDKPLTSAERSRRYRENNPEKFKATQDRYNQRHPERRKEISRSFYARNAESEKARSIRWREKNREKARAHSRKSWSKNREKNLAKSRAYMANNPEKALHYQSNRRARLANAKSYKVLPRELKALKNRPCVMCGSKENIHIDHIIPISRSGTNGIGNLQSLCKTCNLSKGTKTMMEWRISRRYAV